MKKERDILPFIAVIGMALLLVGCGQNGPVTESNGHSTSVMVKNVKEIKDTEEIVWDRRPMIMANGELYLDTGRESDIVARCGMMDGEISSTVDSSEIPIRDNQSNFGDGYSYQYVDESSIDIYMNEKWIRFEKESTDTWGIQLTVTQISSMGMTLLCNQSGGQPTGDLKTGSPYWLKVLIDNQWVSVEMLPSEYDRAWTGEAWNIPMNDSTQWEVNWKELYGELPVGNYRICKEIMDFRGTGDYDTNTYYANFEILN